MAAFWGISGIVWGLLGLAALGGCLVIARVLVMAFASLRELSESIDLSRRTLDSVLQRTRDESANVSERIAKLRGSEPPQRQEPGGPWKDW